MAVWKACENRAWKGGCKGREKVFQGGLFIVNVTEIAEYYCGRAVKSAVVAHFFKAADEIGWRVSRRALEEYDATDCGGKESLPAQLNQAVQVPAHRFAGDGSFPRVAKDLDMNFRQWFAAQGGGESVAGGFVPV